MCVDVLPRCSRGHAKALGFVAEIATGVPWQEVSRALIAGEHIKRYDDRVKSDGRIYALMTASFTPWEFTTGGKPRIVFATVEPAGSLWLPWRGRTSRWWYEVHDIKLDDWMPTTHAYEEGGSGGAFTLRSCLRHAHEAVQFTVAKFDSEAGMAFVCPVCEMVSYNPNDIKYGYCGNCETFTGKPAEDDAA